MYIISVKVQQGFHSLKIEISYGLNFLSPSSTTWFSTFEKLTDFVEFLINFAPLSFSTLLSKSTTVTLMPILSICCLLVNKIPRNSKSKFNRF